MSKVRAASWDLWPVRKERGPNGRGLCRKCGEEVPRGRQSWCSDECYDYVAIRAHPGAARRMVGQRDKGVCANCGTDTKAIERELRDLRYARYGADRVTSLKRYDERLAELREMGFTIDRYNERSLWEADHIVPVVEGGGECDLDNYRTLCTPCHKRVTKEMHARLSARRREVNAPLGLFAEGA